MNTLTFICRDTVFQPTTLQEATVEPIHDDIEITNDGEETDAFAVQYFHFFLFTTIALFNNML